MGWAKTACQKSARARRGLAHSISAGGRSNEPDPPTGVFGQILDGRLVSWHTGPVRGRRAGV